MTIMNNPVFTTTSVSNRHFDNALLALQEELSSSKCQPLSPESTRELIAIAQSSSAKAASARKRIIESNLRLVYKVVNSLYPDGSRFFEDYFNEGVFGLNNAISKFNLEQGSPFSHYAALAIRSQVCDAIENQKATIRLPHNICNDISTINKVQREYSLKHYDTPSEEKLAKLTGISLDLVKRALDAQSLRVDSLDRKVYDDSDSSVSDFLSDDSISRNHIAADGDLAAMAINGDYCGKSEKIGFLKDIAMRLCPASKANTFIQYCDLTQEGYSQSEIAEKLGITSKTLGRHLSAVRTTLSSPQVRSLYQRYAA